jgi:hypothetical protein
MAVIDNLVAYWSLEEASGTRSDSFGSNHLTSLNGVTSTLGKVGNAAAFAAASLQSLSIADNADLSVSGDFSFSAWATPTGVSGVDTIFAKDDNAGNREYHCYFQTAHISFAVFDSSSGFSSVSTGNVISAGVTYHVILTYDSVDKKTRIYLDNGSASVAASPLTNGPKNAAAAFRLGTWADNSFPMEGWIDEVGFWKKVLTASERTWLYNSGAGRSYANIVAEAGALPFVMQLGAQRI